MRGRGPLATPLFSLCLPGELLRGWQPQHPPVGLPGPHPGFLSFHDERNQRRAGAAPLDPGAWLPHFPRSLRFAPARAVLLPAFLPAALQARQHGGHIPPRLSPPPFGTLIACGFPFPYPGKTRGEKKTGLPTSSKWQIGLGLWQKVARRETERSAASAKRAAATHRGIPKGAALGAPLVTFPASGKSPGCRAERLHQGSLGLPAPQNPRGAGRSALREAGSWAPHETNARIGCRLSLPWA